MSAMQELKDLVFKGFLEREVTFGKMKVTLRTLTIVEEGAVLREAGLDNPPTSAEENLRYTVVLLPAVISKLNDEDTTSPDKKEQLKKIFSSGYNADMISFLFQEWIKLEDDRKKASDELKNSQATPNQEPSGQ